MKTQSIYGAKLRPGERALEQETVAYRIQRRRRASFLFSAILVAAYFAFVLIVTSRMPALSGQLLSGLSVAMLLGVVIILGCLVMTSAYIVWLGYVQKAHDQFARKGVGHESR
ncbi:DUF485 domain-containing protein [Burkholderia sp. S171]|uniref:DUF485 domain-containing protein n=1 Tax=Burkholderia sp. S171 TaxID=1641860 RepID=UPI00131BF930|nr:DUF485 domain-containing protein [Burkholderia sp. S171]